MTRKDLQEKYNIIGENSDITLYRKKGEYDYGMGYCGNIALRNGKAVFQDHSYSTVGALDIVLRDWEKSLPYPVDTYNPMMNDLYRIEARLCWYLENKMGFKMDTSEWGDRGSKYTREIGPDYKISFRILRDGLDEDGVAIQSVWGDYHLTHKVKDEEDGISIFNTIVNSTVLSMAKDMIDALDICDGKVTTDIRAFVKDSSRFFGFREVNFKDIMIERLETVLKQLKEE